MARLTRRQMAVAGIAATMVIVPGVAIAGTRVLDDDGADTPITGAALDRATTAALAEHPGGTVTGTEVGDEESLYEVEVRTADGRSVDVQLDEEFAVVGQEDDGPASAELDD